MTAKKKRVNKEKTVSPWGKRGKLSPKRSTTVLQLVQKYREKYPGLKRDLVRQLISSKHSELFKNNPTNLWMLDRWLECSFQETGERVIEEETISPKHEPLTDIRSEVRRAKEEWVNGETEMAYRRIIMVIKAIPEDRHTSRLKSLMLLPVRTSPTSRENSRLLWKINRMIPQFLEELETIATSLSS